MRRLFMVLPWGNDSHPHKLCWALVSPVVSEVEQEEQDGSCFHLENFPLMGQHRTHAGSSQDMFSIHAPIRMSNFDCMMNVQSG